MASPNNLKIFLEFEPIVKLACENLDCKFNLHTLSDYYEVASCNLKQITISKNAECKNYEPRGQNDTRS